MSVALRLANRGYDRHMIAEALLTDDRVLELQRSAGARKAREFVERTAAKALEYAETYPRSDWRPDVVVKVARMREAADSRPWPGRTGPTDRRVLEGAFRTVLLCKSTLFNCSVRTWALRVGLPRTVVMPAIGRLEWIELEKRGSKSRGIPSQYRLRVPMSCSRPVSLPIEVPPVRVPDIPDVGFADHAWLPHDAFRNRALGDAGWLILRRLSPSDPLRASTIAATTGIHRERAYGVLGRLQSAELARKIPDGWVRVGDDEVLALLDRVAATFRTAGWWIRDREHYQEERERDHNKRQLSVRVPDIGEGLMGEVLNTVGELLQVRQEVRQEVSA